MCFDLASGFRIWLSGIAFSNPVLRSMGWGMGGCPVSGVCEMDYLWLWQEEPFWWGDSDR